MATGRMTQADKVKLLFDEPLAIHLQYQSSYPLLRLIAVDCDGRTYNIKAKTQNAKNENAERENAKSEDSKRENAKSESGQSGAGGSSGSSVPSKVSHGLIPNILPQVVVSVVHFPKLSWGAGVPKLS